MILPGTFSREWIERARKRKGFSRINPPVLEKMIHAFALLEALKTAGMQFTFKGGSSIILLLEKPGRFSIDIDITATYTRKQVEEILDRVIECSHFTKYEVDEERSYKEGVPKAHYEFSFQSEYNKSANYVLLDILFEESLYPGVLEVPIESEWLKTDGKSVLVKVPSVESIAGDKLTAFAPNTTGILYNKGKELEIIKQLFDLGNLFEAIKHFKTVGTSFSILAAREIKYRNLEITQEQILGDIIETGLLIARREKNKIEPARSRYMELQKGIAQFKNYLISGAFRIDEAIEAAAKAAYMAAKIKTGNFRALEKFGRTGNINNFMIEDAAYSYLNKLRKLPNGALFYWYHTIKLLK